MKKLPIADNPPDLFVFIHTAPVNFEKRYDIRAFWGQDFLRKYPDYSVHYVFFMGHAADDLDHIARNKTKLEREVESFDDFLIVDLVDSYANLTLKSVAMLRAIKELGIPLEFIFKVRYKETIRNILLFEYL